MADKDIVALIKKHDEERPGLLLDLVLGPGGLSAGLAYLVEDYRKVAELYGQAQLRGGKALQVECRTTANKLALLARGVEQAMRATPPAPPVERPSTPESRAKGAADLERVSAFVADRVAATNAQAATDESAQTLAYLKGETDVLPDMTINESVGPDFTGGAFTAAMLSDPAFTAAMLSDPFVPGPPMTTTVGAPSDVPVSVGRRAGGTCPECGLSAAAAEGAPACGDPWHGRSETFAAADPPEGTQASPAAPYPTLDDPAGSMPGARVSWDDLQQIMSMSTANLLTALGLPEHLSHSQTQTLGECGTKYLLQRSATLGVVEVPQWALVGGNAFHAAAEWFERLVSQVRTAQFVGDRISAAGGLGEVWRNVFGQTVTDTAIANPLVPVDRWRAARKGAEGYTWWLVEGEQMLQRYVMRRMAELERSAGGQEWRRIRWGMSSEDINVSEPMIEHEGSMRVGEIDYKVVLDQVWEVMADEGPMRPGDLLIDDLKSGRSVPVETGQLQEYAMWLSRFGGGEDRRIWGRFYDARRGTYTEPVDLLARASWRRFEFEVAAADRQKRAGLFAPRPSSFCGGCSGKHACPVYAEPTPGAS